MGMSDSPRPMSSAHVLVAGLVRNGGPSLEEEVGRIGLALSDFSRVSWLIVESDSDDDTLELLERMAAGRGAFGFRSLGLLRDRMPLRTERIAYCRNFYLDELQKNPIYGDVDYLIVADLDGVNGELTRESIRSCWERDDWDVCAANQRGLYYDIWALRHPIWSPNDCWEQYRFMRMHGVDEESALKGSVHLRMIRLKESEGWIPVESAFGGLAIYRREALADARYVGVDENGGEVCEHVALHRDLCAKGRRLFVNPGLINGGMNNHSVHATWISGWRRRIKSLLRLISGSLRRILDGR